MQIIGILIILGGVALYFLTPEERVRLRDRALAYARSQRDELLHRWRERGEQAADEAHPREPLALVTFALVLANLWVFTRMLFGAGVLSNEGTLVSWGANFGPRTTNGEWWRLVTAMFVHSSVLHLLADLGGLIAVCVIVERLVGHAAFTIVYFAAGVFASLANLSESPVAPNAGASGAIVGIYGLLFALWLWSVVQRAPISIPFATLKVIGPVVACFLLYTAATTGLTTLGTLAGFVVGFTSGLVLAIGTEERRPELRRIVAVTGATLLLAVIFAVPLRGLADVRPEIGRILAIEGQTTSVYEAAVKRFTDGHIKVAALVKIVDETIAPQLRDASVRLKAIEHVPAEHQPLVAAADQYLQLRTESWRVRSDALQKSNMRGLQKADRLEYESREAFDALKRMSEQ